MSKEKKNEQAFKLRFPEFKDTDEWEEKTLDDVAIFLKGKGITKSDIAINGSYPCIRYGELYTHYKEIIDSIFSFTNLPPEDLIFSESNDVIIPSSGETREDIATASCVIDQGIALGGDLNILRSEINGIFLAYYLTHVKKSEIARLAQGDAVVHLYASQLKKLLINFPKLQGEQQKIADCLSSLDDVITAENQKLEALQAHKKGLVQRLFPAKSEKVPKLRFKEFRNNREWQEMKFDALCKFTRGPFGGALKKEIFVNEGYAVYEQSHAIYNDFNSFRYYITEAKFNELKRFSVRPNDIIMSCSGTMGKFAIAPKELKEGVINQALLKLTVNKGYDVKFIKATLELPENQDKLLSQSAGGAIKNVVEVAQIKEIKLCIPELNEQQKITECLSTIDDLITSQSEKVKSLKAHKKGLMQQLFPDSVE